MPTYGEPFYGSVGPEVQEESNIFSELLSNIYLGYWGQAIRLSTWIATNKQTCILLIETITCIINNKQLK